jgi:NTP pyrophosphatase (non-canonical NTP hydrolase)
MIGSTATGSSRELELQQIAERCREVIGSVSLDGPNIFEIMAVSKRIAILNGFDAPTWENFATKIMFVITELDEAVQASVAGDSENFREEIADVAIRIAAIMSSLGIESSRTATTNKRRLLSSAEVMLWPIVSNLTYAIEAWRNEKLGDAAIALELALIETFRIAGTVGFNLEREIWKKCLKNTTRGLHHGKVRSEG